MSEKRLLFSVTAKDCNWNYYRGTGAGGQKKNKTSSAVRCTHKTSKAVGQAEDTRSQLQNKKKAFRRMVETDKFKLWLKLETARRTGAEKDIEKEVEKSMCSRNIKTEVKDENGKWVKVEFGSVKEE